MAHLLGIDIGTSGTKTGLFDCFGNLICSATYEYPLYQPQNGWAEQDPNDWWDATVKGIRQVLGRGNIDGGDISAIGLSGQMHGLVMLSSSGEVLYPAIIWCDQRTDKECELIERVVGRQKVIDITANPPMTGFTAAKILWIKSNRPKVYEKCAHILLPKDYIRFKLTGEFATDVSDASGMQLLDIKKRKWSKELLGLLDIDINLLGKVYESTDITGYTTAEAEEVCGILKNTPVVGGAADNAAAAVGMGVVSPGKAFTTIGTSGVIYTVTDSALIDPEGRIHTLCASAPGKWTLMSCTQAAGLSLKWLRDTCCDAEIRQAEQVNTDPYIIMDKLAEKQPPGANRLFYLPYLMGERSPHLDPDSRGVFFGLSAMHGRGDLIRAVMEGVAFSQKECLDVFLEMGASISDMLLCGGGSKSRLWRQMIADMYGFDINLVNTDEGPALGAAILAAVGSKVYSSLDEACGEIIKKVKTQKPIEENKKIYDKYFKVYKKLYLQLKDLYKELALVER